jgi:hypothetical protein
MRRFKNCRIFAKWRKSKPSSRDARLESPTPSNERRCKRPLTVSGDIEQLKTWGDDTIQQLRIIKEAFEKRDSGYGFEPLKEEKEIEGVGSLYSRSQTEKQIEGNRGSNKREENEDAITIGENGGCEDDQVIEKKETWNDDESPLKSNPRKGFFQKIFRRRIDSATGTTTIFSEVKTFFIPQRQPTIRLGRPSADPDGRNRTGVFQEDFSNTTQDLQHQDLDPLADRRFLAAEGYRPQSLSSERSPPDSLPPPLPTKHQARNQQPEESDDELSSFWSQDLLEEAS